MMPKLDGWGVLKEIRQYSETPVIMLTAKADEQDELNGFNLGVDEYIAKPFSLKILSARIDAVLRRTTVSDEADLEADGIKINKLAHQVTVDGQIVELSVKEFELLSYFMLNRGIALSRNKILNSVWQYEYDGGARTIDTHVKKLRSKLGEKGKYITTIWGYGYKFECN
jgi:DNA-binding response OmpR family regulator